MNLEFVHINNDNYFTSVRINDPLTLEVKVKEKDYEEIDIGK